MIEPDKGPLRERLVSLTRDLILIPSCASRPDDLLRCHEFIKNHLDTVDGLHVRTYLKDGLPSLVALPKDCAEPAVLMCAHLDVIAHPDVGFYKSEIRDGRIVGPGAGDMKGALAILMELMRDLHRRRPGISLGLAVTSDEESGGRCGIGYLFEERGLRCGTAMIPDGGSLREITVEEKGIQHLRVRCPGRPAHAARPWLGDNPIRRLMEGLERVQRWFDAQARPVHETHWFPTCAVTVIGTENQTINRIPADAYALLDIRFPPPHTTASMLGAVRDALGPGVEVESIISAEPTHLSPDPAYLEATRHVTGAPARLVRDCGGSDARFVCAKGIPVLMSRPRVGNLHAPTEWIDIDSMLQFYDVYQAYLTRKLDLDPAAWQI